MSRGEQLERLREQAAVCTDCALSQTRTHVVFGEGDPESVLMLVGEGPGQWEDRSGRPFVGRAGRLLDDVLREQGLERSTIYLTNIVKCRPTVEQFGRIKNRPPRVGEVRACRKWLDAQIAIIRPRVLVCIGGPSASLLIHKGFKMTQEHGVWFQTECAPYMMAVLHPAYVLRQEGAAFTEARNQLGADIAEVKRKIEAKA